MGSLIVFGSFIIAPSMALLMIYAVPFSFEQWVYIIMYSTMATGISNLYYKQGLLVSKKVAQSRWASVSALFLGNVMMSLPNPYMSLLGMFVMMGSILGMLFSFKPNR